MDEGEFRRLLWRCRRGMKELDVMLENFMNSRGRRLDESRVETLRALLSLQDDTLWLLLSGQQTSTDPVQQALVDDIRTPA